MKARYKKKMFATYSLSNSILKLLKASVNRSRKPFGVSFPYLRSFSFWKALAIIFVETSLHVFPIQSIFLGFYIFRFCFCFIYNIIKYPCLNSSLFPISWSGFAEKSIDFFFILGFLILVILFLILVDLEQIFFYFENS